MAANIQRKRVEAPLSRHLPVVTPAALALLVAMLLAAGCGQTSTRSSTLRTQATPTPTPALLNTVPGSPLLWTAGKLPPGNSMFGVGYQSGFGSVFLTTSDGNTAYACSFPSSKSVGPGIWVTHDRAQHWRALAKLPAVAEHLFSCAIIPDAVDPATVVAAVSWNRPAALGAPRQQSMKDFITRDGGTTWQSMNGPSPFAVDWLATYHGTSVAFMDFGKSAGTANFWISTDHLQTWEELPQGPLGQPWINPATGQILMFGGNASNQVELYQSGDLGRHWTSLAMPSSLNGAPLISPPVAGQPLRMCGTATASTPPPVESISTPIPDISDEGAVMCSMDGGETWTERPNLLTTFDNTDKGTFPQAAEEVAVNPNGTVYAVMPPNPWGTAIPEGMYQLAPNSNLWQSVGSLPEDDIDTATIPGAGILWGIGTDTGAEFAGPLPDGA